jgi:hypothetical protein
VESFTAKSESLHQVFGTSESSIAKLLGHISTIKNANQWESFVATLGGINAGDRANSSIRVQPTTMHRRTGEVTRGSKQDQHCVRNTQVSDQEIWQMRLAIINLMRNHMVLVIKDKIPCLCDFSCS